MTSDLMTTYPTIAEYLNTSPDSVKKLARRHKLPTFKIGKTVAARRSSIDAWIAAREADPSNNEPAE